MPKANFTSRWVQSVPAPDSNAQVDYFDNRTTGFGLRVSRTGRKTWFFMYRIGGRLRRQTLGTYPSLSLADARERAKASSHAVSRNIDPAAVQKAERVWPKLSPNLPKIMSRNMPNRTNEAGEKTSD